MFSPILTVDIGNTRTKFCVWDNQDGAIPLLEFSDSSYTLTSTKDWIQNLPFSNKMNVTWYISSVNRDKTASLREIVIKIRPSDTLKFISLADVPIAVQYDYPEKLGIDRVVAAYAGIQTLGIGRSFLVVDVGTAATIDYVDSGGTFCGGAILPGSRLAAEALQAKTASLPMIEDPENEAVLHNGLPNIENLFHYPATETQAAIRVGVVFSLTGAIASFYWKIRGAQVRTGLMSNIAILLAGGDAQLTMRNLQGYFDDLSVSLGLDISRPEIIIEPRLVHKGLQAIALE